MADLIIMALIMFSVLKPIAFSLVSEPLRNMFSKLHVLSLSETVKNVHTGYDMFYSLFNGEWLYPGEVIPRH